MRWRRRHRPLDRVESAATTESAEAAEPAEEASEGAAEETVETTETAAAKEAGRTAQLAQRARDVAAIRLGQAQEWVGETAERRTVWTFAQALFNRDREAFGSVLGSAIALRLFLFSVSLVVAIVSGMNLIFDRWGIESSIKGVGMTSEMARQVSAAAAPSGRDAWLLVSSIGVALWSGRSLTKVLAACSAGGWRLPAVEAKPSVRVIARVTALFSLLVIAASGLARIRSQFGIAVATSSIALNIGLLGVGWFFVSLALPRPTRDPASVLPGAALFGVVVTAVQWFMHYYLPYKIENASETMGSLGVTVASLSYLFIVGRVMAGTVVLNAVIYEQFGSIAEFVFGLPWIERIPVRFPKVATFFDLTDDVDAGLHAHPHATPEL